MAADMLANKTTGRLLVAVGLVALGACQAPGGDGAGSPGAGGSGPGGSPGAAGGASGAPGGGGGSGAGLAGCADALFALDRSCSMNAMPRGFTKSKYAVAQDVINGVAAEYEGKMAFGLNAYPPLPSEGTKCDAGRVYAGIGLGTASKIASAIASIDPSVKGNMNCGTPTGANLEMLADHAPLRDPGRKHNVILLTDGMPVCGGETVARSVTAIEKLRAQGVSTFVVGYVVGANVRALDMMAQAGGQPQPAPAETRFYNAADPDQLNFALRKILSTICSDIPTPGCPASATACSPSSTCPDGTSCSSGCCFPVIR
jgi:hypothetical protein